MKRTILKVIAMAATALAGAVVWAITPATTLPTFKAACDVVKLAASDASKAARKLWADLAASYAIRVAPWSAAFQSAIQRNQAFGVPGEIAFDGPRRVRPGVLKGTAANIVVGRFFTIDPADGFYLPGGDAGIPGGVLIHPKHYASFGTQAGGALAPTLTLAANTAAEFMTMGEIVVALSTACTIGDGVFYDDVTGILGAGVAGIGQTQIAGAQVVRYSNVAPGLAVISLTGA